MRILVTGATGSVGKFIINEFSKNYKIYATYRNKKNLLKKKNIKWISFDKIDKKNVKGDIIINCIASHEKSKNNSFFHYMNSNILTVNKLINLYYKNNFRLLINLSTISVYEKNIHGIIKENSQKESKNILSLTKLIGEILIQNSGINYLNLRLPSVIDFDKNNYNWVNKTFNLIKKNKNLTIFNAKNKINSIIDKIELTNFLKKILKKKKFNYKKTFNFVSNKDLQVKEIINLIKYKTNSNSKITYRRKKNLKKKYCSNIIYNYFNYNLASPYEMLERNL